jgi:sodium transport system permease protein
MRPRRRHPARHDNDGRPPGRTRQRRERFVRRPLAGCDRRHPLTQRRPAGAHAVSGWRTVVAKEVKDGFRERRAVFSALIFGPLFGPLLFAGIMAFSVERTIDEGDRPLAVPVVHADAAPNLVQFLARELIEAKAGRYADAGALRDAVRTGREPVGIVVDVDFGEALADGRPARVWIVSDSANSATRAAVTRVNRAIAAYDHTIGALRLSLRGVDATLLAPLAILDDDVATPSGRSILLLGMITYFLLFASLLGGMHVAIDGTAGERERGSLEPLLTLPMPRAELLFGKLLATGLFMACALAISVASFATAVQFLPLSKIGMTANFGLANSAAIFAVVVPFVAVGATLITVVATFTKTFKEAQSYAGIAMIAPTLPIVFAALNPLQPSLPLMLVPSLSQHLLVTGIIKGEPVIVAHVAASAASTLCVAVLLAAVAMWRYRSERLVV